MTWRAFGSPGDLDLDFHSADRPVLVSRVLATCRSGCDPAEALEQAWSLSLGARIGALAEILARTGEEDALVVPLTCPRCAEPFEVRLSLAAIGELGREARGPRVEVRLADGPRLALRRPTGADQRRWLADPDLEEADVLNDLLLEGDMPAQAPGLLARVAEAMAEADLLPAFAVHSACPHCGHADDLPLDLEGLLLARLAGQARRLIRAVHRLASRYGWREADILALPGHRRAAYLDLLDQEGTWP
ncbi:MAG: hypothetical protein AB1899_08050 [Pseudomonadota bacterium]